MERPRHCVGRDQGPQRNNFRATLYGMAIIVGLYLVANVAYHYAIPIAEMPRYERVAEAAGLLGGRGATALSAVIFVSILGALNGSILSGARIPYAAATDLIALGVPAYLLRPLALRQSA